jgi:hypothetical protein
VLGAFVMVVVISNLEKDSAVADSKTAATRIAAAVVFNRLTGRAFMMRSVSQILEPRGNKNLVEK